MRATWMRKILAAGGLTVMLLSATTASIGAAKSGSERSVLRATLDNGLRVVIVQNNLAPVVTTMVNYLVGSNEAPEGFPGTAHAQEHMMFRGSPGLTADQMADIIAAMGGLFDADTQQTVTQYYLTVPAEFLDLALHIEAIRMRGVLDSEQLWMRERGAIDQEVTQDLSNPEYILYVRILADIFKGTPYARTPLGTVSSFDKTTGAALKKFYDTWYAPNNAILVIVGAIDPAKALDEVKRFFGHIPAKKIPERASIRLRPVKPLTLHLKTDQSYGLAMISFRMPGYESPDYAASRVLADALSNQRSNLYALVPEGKALFAAFTLNTLPGAGLGYAMAAFPKGADASALISELRKIITEETRKGFPADLVEAAKRTTLTKSELRKNSIFGLAAAWSRALAVEGMQTPEDEIKSIRDVSVSDVDRVARKYLRMDETVDAILTPEASGKPSSMKVPDRVEPFSAEHVKRVKLPDWAEKALKRLHVPSYMINPVDMTLSNGIRLIVQPVAVSDTISVYGHIKNQPGLETPKGKEGVDQVLSQLLSYGTTTLDRVALQKALDDIGAGESAGTDFSLKVLSDYFERGVQLLADNQLRPALPEKGFIVARQQIAAAAAGRLQSPAYLADRALKAALFPPTDPTLRQTTPASVLSLTLEDVKDYHRKTFRPDLTTIVVIGKVTPEQAKTVIGKYFGSWTASGSKPETFLPPVPANRPSSVSIPDASRIQDKVALAEILGLTRSNPDYYALELGNHVLGGTSFTTRLYRDLREETGLVYYVNSFLDVGVTRSLYAVQYGCDPQRVSRVRDIVERNLRQMQASDVSSGELEQAKAHLLRQIPLSESSVESIAAGLLYRVTHGLPLNEPIAAAHRYLKLSAEDVKAAFHKWVRPGDLVQVIEGPMVK